MKKLLPLENKIYNAGERLIPGVTHDLDEVIRHRSSYLFFRHVIELDAARQAESSSSKLKPIRIIDIGCGVGHGCATLAEIPNAEVVGIDFSPESIEYAKNTYHRTNINYQVVDLAQYIPTMPEFDYVVSRNVFEHVPNGLKVALTTNWRNRLMFDVPYDEPESRNEHHALWHIREESFEGFPRHELLYQDLQGTIYDSAHKPQKVNVIMCVCSHPDLNLLSESGVRFPVAAWQPSVVEAAMYSQSQPSASFLERGLNKLKRRMTTLIDK